MSDEKATAQLRYDFLMAAFNQMRASANSAVEHSQAALQSENNPALKEYFAALFTASQELLNLIVGYLSLEPGRWTDEFVVGLRYEIWPLCTTIIGYSTWLPRGAWGPIDEAQKPMLIRIEKSGYAILRIFDWVLDACLIERYRTDTDRRAFDFAEGDLKGIIGEFVGEFVPPAGKRQMVEIETHGLNSLPRVWVDSVKISKVLKNYVAAALRENSSQGKIMLTAGCDGDMVTVRLENAGFALPAAAIEEFERIGSAGTLFACRRFDEALDLCIGQAIVEIHGGKLWIGDRAGGGSLIAFTLPAMKR